MDDGICLKHHEGHIGTLDPTHLEKVMEYLRDLWGGGVVDIETVDENGDTIHYTYDELGFSHDAGFKENSAEGVEQLTTAKRPILTPRGLGAGGVGHAGKGLREGVKKKTPLITGINGGEVFKVYLIGMSLYIRHFGRAFLNDEIALPCSFFS